MGLNFRRESDVGERETRWAAAAAAVAVFHHLCLVVFLDDAIAAFSVILVSRDLFFSYISVSLSWCCCLRSACSVNFFISSFEHCTFILNAFSIHTNTVSVLYLSATYMLVCQSVIFFPFCRHFAFDRFFSSGSIRYIRCMCRGHYRTI